MALRPALSACPPLRCPPAKAFPGQLGWEEIEATRVNLGSVALGEYHENEMRKAFTVTERVAIGEAVERMIGKRQGQRTDRKAPGSHAEVPSQGASRNAPAAEVGNKLPQNFAEVPGGAETRKIAAEAAGFGNERTYEQAKEVAHKGCPELKEAVDREEVSVSDAAAIANEPPEVQRGCPELRELDGANEVSR